MTYKYEYETEEERQQLIDDNENLYLIEEQNLFTGNFLIFSEEPEVVYENVPKDEFEELKLRQDLQDQVIDVLLGGEDIE